MANLKEIRQRINSVKNTRQVTSAMKLVSAAKLRKAQDAIVQLRPYANKLYEILKMITASLDDGVNRFAEEREQVQRVMLIAIASNRGLCGPFNTNVVRETINQIEGRFTKHQKNGTLDIVVIGKKVEEVLRIRGYRIAESHNDMVENPSAEAAAAFAEQLMQAFLDKKYDQIHLVYNQFKNAAVQRLNVEQYLPVQLDEGEQEEYHKEYIFEPSLQGLLEDIVPMTIKTEFQRALLNSVAAEHGARMTAMHQATDNATDLIRDLNLTYNKARQAAITREINEIVAGADALEN